MERKVLDKKGLTLVELIISATILTILAATMTVSVVQYMRKARARVDEASISQILTQVEDAMFDSDVMAEVYAYVCSNNYSTYTDSSGEEGECSRTGEAWTPDGTMTGITITLNPVIENGKTTYSIKNALVNDMTTGSASSVLVPRALVGSGVSDPECVISTMNAGNGAGKLYNAIVDTFGDTIEITSDTYQRSSYTIFIEFTESDGEDPRIEVRGSFNGMMIEK